MAETHTFSAETIFLHEKRVISKNQSKQRMKDTRKKSYRVLFTVTLSSGLQTTRSIFELVAQFDALIFTGGGQAQMTHPRSQNRSQTQNADPQLHRYPPAPSLCHELIIYKGRFFLCETTYGTKC